MPDIRQKVRLVRSALGLTQEDFAKRIGFSRNTVIEVEKTGKASSRFIRQLEILAADPRVSRVLAYGTVQNVQARAENGHSVQSPRERLRHARERAGLSVRELARQTGYSVGVLQAIESGAGQASERMIEKICEVVPDVTKEELMGGSDEPPVIREDAVMATYGTKPPVEWLEGKGGKFRYIPLISMAQAGTLAAGYIDEGYTRQSVLAVDVTDPKAFAVELRGDSMSPRFTEGDKAILLPNAQLRSGDICIARTIDGDVMCKIYQPKDGGRIVILSSYNPAYPPVELNREDIAWIYPVSSVIQQVRKD